jgi:hypothetical protein
MCITMHGSENVKFALLISTHFGRCGGLRFVVLVQSASMDDYSYGIRACMFCSSMSQTPLLADPFSLLTVTADPHILGHVNRQCADDRCPKLKICMSEVILDSYEYMPVAYVTMNCMI